MGKKKAARRKDYFNLFWNYAVKYGYTSKEGPDRIDTLNGIEEIEISTSPQILLMLKSEAAYANEDPAALIEFDLDMIEIHRAAWANIPQEEE